MADINRTSLSLPKVAPVVAGEDPAADIKAVAERIDRVLTSLEHQMQNFEAADTSKISGVPAGSVISGSSSMYFQTFEDDITENWVFLDGAAAAISFPINGQAGGHALRTTLTEVILEDDTFIPFDPSRLYRMRTRYRDISGAHRPLYVGVRCYDGDKVLVGTYQRVCASVASNSSTSWSTTEGYFKGAASAVNITSPSSNSYSPNSLRTGTAYIRPYLHLSVGADDQTAELDYITLEILTETQEVDELLQNVDGRAASDISSTVKSGSGVAENKVDNDSIAADAVDGGGTGGKNVIKDGTIVADNIKAGTITANEIAADTITAGNISTLTMTGKSCTFDTGSVGGWTMASGNLSSGNVSISATAEQMLFGSATAPMSGTGVFIGKDGSDYEFRCGNPAGEYIHWNGSALTVGGTITAQNFTSTAITLASGETGGKQIRFAQVSTNPFLIFGGSAWLSKSYVGGSPGALELSTYSSAGSTSVLIQASGGAADTITLDSDRLGFYGGTPQSKPTVSGSRGGNAALASLLTGLANLGLITDSSS
jgi:hypothetical protein